MHLKFANCKFLSLPVVGLRTSAIVIIPKNCILHLTDLVDLLIVKNRIEWLRLVVDLPSVVESFVHGVSVDAK